jgi:hypothetical protein
MERSKAGAHPPASLTIERTGSDGMVCTFRDMFRSQRGPVWDGHLAEAMSSNTTVQFLALLECPRGATVPFLTHDISTGYREVASSMNPVVPNTPPLWQAVFIRTSPALARSQLHYALADNVAILTGMRASNAISSMRMSRCNIQSRYHASLVVRACCVLPWFRFPYSPTLSQVSGADSDPFGQDTIE